MENRGVLINSYTIAKAMGDLLALCRVINDYEVLVKFYQSFNNGEANARRSHGKSALRYASRDC
jgi:hypothetical protein